MATEAVKRAKGLPDLLNEARQLDLHYIPSRYPNGLPGGYPHQFYARDTAEEALGSAQKIVDAAAEYYRGVDEEEILREQE
jgi:HEPN domain-containing protein